MSTLLASLVIGLHLHTVHVGDESEKPPALRNQDHTPGLFVRMPEWSLLGAEPTAGIYRNSLGRTSVYGGLTWQTESKRLAASLALASGYQYRRVTGQRACGAGYVADCWWDHGSTKHRLMPIGALSIAFPETRPFLLGGTARVLWIGKGVSLALEWSH